MTKIEKDSFLFSLISICIISVLLVFVFSFVKFDKTVKYKTIKISLSSPVEKMEKNDKSELAIPEKSKAEIINQNKPIVQEKKNPQVVKKKQNQNTEKLEKKSVSKISENKKSEPVIKKSVEDLMNEQLNTKKKTVEFDDSLFDDDSFTRSSSSDNFAKSKASSSLSGVSGLVEETEQKNQNQKDDVNTSANDYTKEILSQMETSNSYEINYSSSSIPQEKVLSKKSNFVFSGGKERTMYSLMELKLSDSSSKYFSSSVTVKVIFKILANGTVPKAEINFSPSGLLPFTVQDELRNQIKNWRFSDDPSGNSVIATFNFYINVK